MDKKYVANTYSRTDVEFVRGQGSKLYDSDENEYIDLGAGIAVNTLGHNYKEWVYAVNGQLATLAHTSNLYYTAPQAVLAKTLCERTAMEKVFFSNSGAEANECAIKCARKYSCDKYGAGRDRIVVLKNSFHGRTMATISATAQDGFHQHFMPFLDGFDVAYLNDIASVKQAITDKTCAIMLEFIQGEGGINVATEAFITAVKELCEAQDILLIADEVQTGIGRTGNLYAFMHYGIVPDIVTSAKGLGNGLPIGATLFGKKTANTLTYGTHGSTFGGNVAICKGAKVVLDTLDEDFLLAVDKKSKKIIDTLSECSGVKSITGKGLMLGIACDDAKDKVQTLLSKGVVVLTAKDKIRLLPSLNITEQELDTALKVLKEVLL